MTNDPHLGACGSRWGMQRHCRGRCGVIVRAQEAGGGDPHLCIGRQESRHHYICERVLSQIQTTRRTVAVLRRCIIGGTTMQELVLLSQRFGFKKQNVASIVHIQLGLLRTARINEKGTGTKPDGSGETMNPSVVGSPAVTERCKLERWHASPGSRTAEPSFQR